jgi:hypothetical protein
MPYQVPKDRLSLDPMGLVRLRFARFGRKDRPFYRIVAIDSRKARDAQPLEYVRDVKRCPFELALFAVTVCLNAPAL